MDRFDLCPVEVDARRIHRSHPRSLETKSRTARRRWLENRDRDMARDSNSIDFTESCGETRAISLTVYRSQAHSNGVQFLHRLQIFEREAYTGNSLRISPDIYRYLSIFEGLNRNHCTEA